MASTALTFLVNTPPPVSVGPSGRGLGPTPPLQPALLWKARPCLHSGRRCFQSRSSACPILGQQMKFQPGPPNWPSAFWMGAGPGREELKEKERWGPASHGACALGLAASPTLCPQGPCVAWAPASFTCPVLALYSRTGEAAAGRVHRPTGPSARGTGLAASGPLTSLHPYSALWTTGAFGSLGIHTSSQLLSSNH